MADIKISQLGEALAVTDNDILPMTASGVTSKVKASTMKSYMVDDLDVSDLHDTTITTPTDDDGLVYNGTNQKWENKQITTKEQWKKNGAYNLLRPTMTTQSVGGLTLTLNSDGSVTVSSGTATSTVDVAYSFKGMTPPSGNYRLVGCPSGGSASTYNLRVLVNNANTNKGYDYGSGLTFAYNEATDINISVYLRIESGTVISAPMIFKPMITTDLNATYDDYVPYAKTNRELTEDTTNISYDEYSYKGIQIKAEKIGKVARVSIFGTASETVSSGAIYTLPDKYKPKNVNAQGLLIDASTFSALGMVSVLTDGKVNVSVAVPNGTVTRSTTLCYVTA